MRRILGPLWRSIALTILVSMVSGCSPVRFVVDVMPARDELTETVVLEDDDATWGARSVALIEVDGILIDANQPGLFAPGENPVDRFAEALRRAEEDHSVEAVIIRVNSPGGTVVASDTMYREVRRFRERTEKPVVVIMADVAASGAFYLSCAADHVVANPATTTGSIGVIIQTFNVSEGMRMIGISADAITSGPNKALASPFEPKKESHRRILQSMVDEFAMKFVAIVRERRPALNESDLAWVTDGRVISGAKAAEVGLIDETGDLYDAFAKAKELASLRAAKLVKYHRPIAHVGSPYALAPPTTNAPDLQVNVAAPGSHQPVGFYYLWDPSIAW